MIIPDSLTDLRGNQSSRIVESSRGTDISPRRYAFFLSFFAPSIFANEVPRRIGNTPGVPNRVQYCLLRSDHLPFERDGLKSSR